MEFCYGVSYEVESDPTSYLLLRRLTAAHASVINHHEMPPERSRPARQKRVGSRFAVNFKEVAVDF